MSHPTEMATILNPNAAGDEDGISIRSAGVIVAIRRSHHFALFFRLKLGV
jgi:hypothetical protein